MFNSPPPGFLEVGAVSTCNGLRYVMREVRGAWALMEPAAQPARRVKAEPGTTTLVFNAPVVTAQDAASLGRPPQPALPLRGPEIVPWQPVEWACAGNTLCPRCGGPGYLGLGIARMGSAIECLRVGGCLTIDERIGKPVVCRVSSSNPYRPEMNWLAETDGPGTVHGIRSEAHVDFLRATGRVYGHHPTREGAIAAWREKAIAAERGK